MNRRDTRTTAVVVGWATIGLLIGHVAAYDLVYPDGHIHGQVLEATGHGWLSMVEPSMVIALLVALVAGLAGSRAGMPREARFRVLVAIQVGAFLGIELLERVGHGLSLADIGHEFLDHGLWLVLIIGVVAQVLTAWLGSAFSRTVARAAQAARSRPATAHRQSRPQLLPLSQVLSLRFGAVQPNGIRGPPLPAPTPA